jgi:hypothetical protein
MPRRPGRARVRFDADAVAEDIGRLSAAGVTAIQAERKGFERDGVPVDRLRACQDQHRSGTSLPGCVKVYVPEPAGAWRIVFQIAIDEQGRCSATSQAESVTSRGTPGRRTRTKSPTTASTGGGRDDRAEAPTTASDA